MHSPRLTRVYFGLEALNSLSTTCFFYYFYFFTAAHFGFSNKQNLALAASLGLCYGIASLFGGRLSQKRGYLAGLKLGLALMCGSIATGAFFWPVPVQIGLVFVGICAMAFTWPPLEALVSEGQPADRLQRNIGIYNILWAAFGALGYFFGGAMIRAWGFRAMFIVPAALQGIQLAITIWAERQLLGAPGAPASARQQNATNSHAPTGCPRSPDADPAEYARSPVAPQTFLKMAWLANPFGYLAINTVVALIPAIAQRLDLSVMWAGFVGSIWQFVRTAGFAILWLWSGWHYRFRWLAAAYIGMSAGFIAMLLAPNVAVLVAAEIVFGGGLALLYYSSLYYSMHVGETKGEHGGVHEAMIGAGCCAGPAIGALSLHYLPQYASSGTFAVAGLLLSGFAALMYVRYR